MLLALLLTSSILLLDRPATAQDSAQQNAHAGIVVRPCSIADVGPKSSKGPKKNKKDLEDRAVVDSSSCLEIYSTSLDIQEYLQTYVRDLNWKIVDEHIAEDSWTFLRNLERYELLSYTKSDADTVRVTWTSGKAFVQARTAQLQDGFTRVQISARFQGYGQSSDRFVPAKESWHLDSNGTLESQLLFALQTHVKSLH